MATSQKASIKRALLAEVPKRGQEEIGRIMQERGGKAGLQEFLTKRWHFEDHLRSEGLSKKHVAQRVTDMNSQIAAEHPGWSQERISTALSLSYLMMDLKEVSIARRFTLEDPAELARGLSVLSRVRWLNGLIGGDTQVDYEVILDAFAARDLPAAQRLTEGEPAVSQGEPEFLDRCSLAVAALYRKGFAKVCSITRDMAKQKLRPWQQGTCTCLAAIADGQPKQVAEGLARMLDGIRKMRQKGELEEAIYLPAHGLHRLAEWISPDLVAQFDVTQPLPWDAEFHAWCQNHSEPLTGVELSGISTGLHEAVVQLQPPVEWRTSPST